MTKKYFVSNPANVTMTYSDGTVIHTTTTIRPSPSYSGIPGKIQISSPAWQMLKLYPVKYFLYWIRGKFYK